MSELFSWLAKSGMEIKIRTNYDNETYNVVFIHWDINNKRQFTELNVTFAEVQEAMEHPKTILLPKLEFIEFQLKGTISR